MSTITAPSASGTGPSIAPVSLPQAIAQMSERFESLWLSYGPRERDWVPLSTLGDPASTVFPYYLGEQEACCPGLDARGQTAFLIGRLAYQIGLYVAAFHLETDTVPPLGANALAVKSETYTWHYNGESGESVRLVLRVLASKIADLGAARHRGAGGGADRTALIRAQIETLFTPLIARLQQDTRLGRKAQWRLVADSMAAAYQAVGETLGVPTRARSKALALIGHKDSPLFNRQTQFRTVWVDLPDAEGVSFTYRARGGCCRYYTADGGEYCNTCVLRSQDDRDARIAAYVREIHALDESSGG